MNSVQTDFVRACHEDNVSEAKRLYAISPEECASLLHQAYQGANANVNPFLLEIAAFPSMTVHRAWTDAMGCYGTRAALARYVGMFPTNLQSLWSRAVYYGNYEAMVSLVLDHKHAVSDFAVSIKALSCDQSLDKLLLVCSQPTIVDHASSATMAAVQTLKLGIVQAVCETLVKRGVPKEIIMAEITPKTELFVSVDIFQYLDERFGPLDYDAWTRTGESRERLTTFLVRHKRAKLTGSAWNWVSHVDPSLASFAIQNEQADWRECGTAPTLSLVMRDETIRMRIRGFDWKLFSVLPKSMRETLRTTLIALRGRAPLSPALITMLLDQIIVARSWDLHHGTLRLSGETIHCDGCARTTACARCATCSLSLCSVCGK